jgi:putative transposase
MIRSTTVSTKFCNVEKLRQINEWISEYNKVVSLLIDELWNFEKVPTLIDLELSNKIKPQTFLPARFIQAAGKEASGIVRGTQKKNRARIWMIAKLKSEGKFKKSRKLEKIAQSLDPKKSSLKKEIAMRLDSRFIKISLEKNNSFDGWITFAPGNKDKIYIPFRRTRHFNRLIEEGFSIRPSVSIGRKSIMFFFEKETVNNSNLGLVAGVDIGIKTCLSVSTSDGKFAQTPADNHGWTLDRINDKLSRKRKGSKSFERAQKHRHNFVCWSVNQLDMSGLKELRIENIRNLGKYKRLPRKLKHFKYAEIFDRLEQKAELFGVQVTKVCPTYTSQRCSACSWTCRSNRKLKQFRCTSCGFTQDADLNASVNIRLNLKPIGKKERLLNKNRKGFFWNLEEKYSAEREFIVPVVHEVDSVES